MIFLDTNVILRFLVTPRTERNHQWNAQATRLFDQISEGSVQATLSEVVVHEVCSILASRHHYNRSPEDIITRMSSILRFTGMWFDGQEQSILLRALDLWESHPKLEFSDGVIAARCEKHGHQLVTFDRHFEAIPTVARWSPDPPASAAP